MINATIPSEQLLKTLHKLYTEEDKKELSFKDFQKDAINTVLNGKDALVTVPTGGGKSVCYQVPAMHLPGVTLVVSPLLALMEDQVSKLKKNGFPVAALSSEFIADESGFHDLSQTDSEENKKSTRKRRQDIYQGAAAGKYKLIYVTPERLHNGHFIDFATSTKISMIAIDEAHCISMWGYEFRPRYLEISKFIKRIGYRPVIMALTATLTKSVRWDIVKRLEMKNCAEIGEDTQKRENLHFSTESMKSKGAKKRRLLKYLQNNTEKSGFIYCSTAPEVNEVYEYLKLKGISSVRYYSKLDNDKDIKKEENESKKENIAAFKDNKVRVIVTTNALGMGIDKKDIRFVIHYNLPLCLENYYQEAGRAGRDGKDADCILLYFDKDENICNDLIQTSIANSELSPRDRKLRKEVLRARLSKMILYAKKTAEDNIEDPQNFITDYFNTFDPKSANADYDVIKNVQEINVLFANRTLIAQSIRSGKMSGHLKVGRSKGPAITVSYDVTGEKLSYFDMMVADAVYTLISHHVYTIYAKNVMEILSGNTELTLRPDRKAAVEDSIRKMMAAKIRIDRSSSMKYGFGYHGAEDRSIIEGPFLPLFEKKAGFGYNAATPPPLYDYAKLLNGQFYSFPAKYLKVKGLPSSVENLAMTHYLLCRIDSMYGKNPVKGRSHTGRIIRFDSLLKSLSIDLPKGGYYRRREEDNLWNKMLTILTHLQAVGFITNYETDHSKQRVTINFRNFAK